MDLFITSFSISVLNVAIMLSMMIFFLLGNKDKTKASTNLIIFLIGATVVFLSFFVIFSSLDLRTSINAWRLLHIVVFATVAMVQFAYHFPHNPYLKESKIVFWITLAASTLVYPYYIYQTSVIEPIYTFDGNMFVFPNTPEIGIVIGLELIWVMAIFARKAILYASDIPDASKLKKLLFSSTREAMAMKKLIGIFLSPVVLIVFIVLAYLGMISWEIVAHILGTGLTIFVLLFISVYINNSPETSTFLLKLIGISLGIILVLLGFTANITLAIQKYSYDQIRELEVKQMAQSLGAGASVQYKKIGYVRKIENKTATTIYASSEFSKKIDNKISQNGFITLNKLDSKEFYKVYTSPKGDFEIGYSYLDFRKFVHQTAIKLTYLLILAFIVVMVILPPFFRYTIFNPLKVLLRGVKEVNRGNLEIKVPVIVNDEIGLLANSFNHMVESVLDARLQLKHSFDHQVLLTDAYSCFVPSEILTTLDKNSIIDLKLGDNKQRDMTILFSDIRSFTTLSESMGPQESFNFINSYLRRVGPVVRAHNGYIDKYIGDAIMALFPLSPEDAINAAIGMQKEVDQFNQERKENFEKYFKGSGRKYNEVKIGIGVHSGTLMLGTVGEERRMEGTVISDDVNLASRIEGLTKMYDANIMITLPTIQKMKQSTEFNWRFLDRVQVKGKQEWVDIYEVMDSDPKTIFELKKRFQTDFENAVKLFQNGDIDNAFKIFKDINANFPEDVSTHLYLDRCAYFVKYGVPMEWNGVTKLDHK